MRSLAIEKYGRPEDYRIMQLLIPKIDAPDQVLIKVHAASINPIDVKVASGMAKMIWSNKYVNSGSFASHYHTGLTWRTSGILGSAS